MSFLFELPRSNKELLEDANCSNYFVKQIYNADEIPAHLRSKFDSIDEIFSKIIFYQMDKEKLHFEFVFFFVFSQLHLKH